MATTTNFGWETPDDTDLVKDGALAMRTLGNAIDASLVDLKGGTTGQVLSKNSNTDMDFTWVTSDDANAIQNAIVDAKGDLIAATAADTPARLSVGNNGETLVADSSASTGLRWQSNFAAGKNKIINGDFGIWQRGTSFNPSATGFFMFADRWRSYTYAASATTASQQTFTPGSAPVAGYEGTYFARVLSTNTFAYFSYNGIENVRTLAGQTVTLSYWAKSASGQTLNEVQVAQYFGSSGSTVVNTNLTAPTITTSWARYTHTFTMPSISGKTISGGNDGIFINIKGAINNALDIWGVQLEAGDTATAFQTATGTLAGELAACQRYYWRWTAANNYNYFLLGSAYGSTNALFGVQMPTQMRSAPTSVDFANLTHYDGVSFTAVTNLTINSATQGPNGTQLTSSAASGLTQYRPYFLLSNNTTNGYVGLSAEL